MATKKDLYDDAKKDGLLKDAVKKVKAKKGSDTFPCVFGLGKNGPRFVLDWKKQNDPSKLFLEMKKHADKAFLGEATINGDLIEIDIKDSKGGKIKPVDVKRYLSQFNVKKCKLSQGGKQIEDDEPNR